MTHEILLIDAMRGMAGLANGTVDMIFSDPAYSSLEKWRNMGTTTRLKKSTQSSNAWFPTVSNDYFDAFFHECYRVLRSGTDMYVMCDEETSEAIKPKIRNAGFQLRKSIVWWKVGKEVEVPCSDCGNVLTHTNKPGVPGMGYPFRSCWEFILIGRKGKRRKPEDLSVRNVQPIPIEDDDFHNGVVVVPWIKRKGAYPTEKPVELIEVCIKQSSVEGELVLDPFAGSGSTGEAAFNLGREFLGFDVEQDALDYFESRKARWGDALAIPRPITNGRPGIIDFFGKKP